MIFITGAEGAGKRTFAESLGYCAADMTDAEEMKGLLAESLAAKNRAAGRSGCAPG